VGFDDVFVHEFLVDVEGLFHFDRGPPLLDEVTLDLLLILSTLLPNDVQSRVAVSLSLTLNDFRTI
jgi:hypothetical protein